LINPGEAISLDVTLKNVGLDPAPGVTATLSTADSYVTVTDGSAVFGDMAGAGASRPAADPFVIQVDGACPTPHEVTLELNISDTDGGAWTDSFTLTVYTSSQVSGQVTAVTGGAPIAGATIEYALTHLHVRNIIVCGHTDCGGIHALDIPLDQLAEPNLARWIEYARPAQTQVDAWGVDPALRHRRIVEQNVRLQMDNLRTYDIVRRALPANRPSLHGWVYDLATGRVSYWDAETDRFVEEGTENDAAESTS